MEKKLDSRESVSNYEKSNYGTIVFALSKNKEFWEVIENSAFIMYNTLHEKLRLKTKILPYLDYYTSRQSMRIAYHESKIKGIERDLIADGVKLVSDSKNIKVFKLKKAIDKKQFTDWRKTEEMQIARRDALLEPSIHSPEMSRLVRELGNEIILAVEKMRASLKGTFDKKLVGILGEIYDILDEEKVDGDTFNRTLKRLGFQVSILTDKMAIDEKRSLRIGAIIQNLRKAVSTENAERRVNKRKR